MPPYYRPRERPWIQPYSVPLLEERVVVFCHRDVFANGQRPAWPLDYQGLTFGNNRGFLSADQPFWQAVQSGLIRVEEAPGTRANLQKLLRRRIDCYFNDRISILSELAKMKRDGLYPHGSLRHHPRRPDHCGGTRPCRLQCRQRRSLPVQG